MKGLDQLLRGVGSARRGTHSWLQSASYWYLAALREKDPWKRFQWSWLSLEILTHKLGERLHADVVQSLRLAGAGGDTGPGPIPELIWERNRLPLKAKFTIAALGLHQEDAQGDVARFADAKKFRDALSHGDLRDEGQLPTPAVRELLYKYLAAAVQHQFNAPEIVRKARSK